MGYNEQTDELFFSSKTAIEVNMPSGLGNYFTRIMVNRQNLLKDLEENNASMVFGGATHQDPHIISKDHDDLLCSLISLKTHQNLLACRMRS